MKNIWLLENVTEMAKYCQTHWAEDCSHIIRIADEVCQNYFLFDLKWDMERTWEPVIFPDVIDWNYMPGDDIEFIFQFNRHRYFICLGQAYVLTGDERYAKKLVEMWQDWIWQVKKTDESVKGPWRSLETGIRGESWTKALAYIVDSVYLTDEIVSKVKNSLIEHAEYLIEVQSPYRYISNWGVIENHGLFEIGMAMTDPDLKTKYTTKALAYLEIQARMQIMGDGVHWEQSPMYHNEVLHCFEDVWILAKRNNLEIPAVIKEAVKKMAYANVAWKKPDHHQFIMGDSDDTDLRDYISVAAYLTKDPVLKFSGFARLDFESIWDLGMKAALEYQQLDSCRPDFTSVALTDSGNYYLRSDWQQNANLLHFHCGTLGAGHGHSDKLHIDLVINGEDILMDAGRYTYVNGPERFEFKDPCNHNTLTVDNQWFTVCQDSWECSKLSQPVKQQFVLQDAYEFIQGGHLGYMDLPEAVFINRKIVHIKPDLYIIVDECYSGGNHQYQQYFHFNNHGQVSQNGNQIHYQGIAADAVFYLLTEGIDVTMSTSRISRHYNQTENRINAKISKQSEGFQSLITVIHGTEKGQRTPIEVTKIPVSSALKGIQYPDSMAEAVKITVRNTEYIVIICHQEVNSPTDLVVADGCMGFGNVTVFNKSTEQLVGDVLLY